MFDTTKVEFQSWWRPYVIKSLNAEDLTLMNASDIPDNLKGVLTLVDFNQRVAEAKGVRLTHKSIFDGAGNTVSIETSGV